MASDPEMSIRLKGSDVRAQSYVAYSAESPLAPASLYPFGITLSFSLATSLAICRRDSGQILTKS